jgi:hypothetical protein
MRFSYFHEVVTIIPHVSVFSRWPDVDILFQEHLGVFVASPPMSWWCLLDGWFLQWSIADFRIIAF